MNYSEIASKIETSLKSNFINAGIFVVYEELDDEYIIYTKNKELYFSDEYQEFVSELKNNILWKKRITNFYFALDLQPIQSNIDIFLSRESEQFIDWGVHKSTSSNVGLELCDLSLAA